MGKALAAAMVWLMAELWAMLLVVHWGVALVLSMGKASAAEMVWLMAEVWAMSLVVHWGVALVSLTVTVLDSTRANELAHSSDAKSVDC